MKVTPLPKFGAEITDISLPDLDDAGLRVLLETLYSCRYLVVRTCGISSAEYVSLARRAGNPITLSGDPNYPEIAVMTNRESDSLTTRRGAAHWHSDQSFKEHRASITMLYSVQAPAVGGETRFCNLAGAFEALPEATRSRLRRLTVAHRHGVSVSARPGDHAPIPPPNWDQSHTVYHPLVLAHPVTGQETLYAITGTAQGIVDMDHETGSALLKELCDHAFQEVFVSAHKYSEHDLVMWDNPTTLHSASPIGQSTGKTDLREIHRISLKGTPSIFC